MKHIMWKLQTNCFNDLRWMQFAGMLDDFDVRKTKAFYHKAFDVAALHVDLI